jgi:hypothetical protein
VSQFVDVHQHLTEVLDVVVATVRFQLPGQQIRARIGRGVAPRRPDQDADPRGDSRGGRGGHLPIING